MANNNTRVLTAPLAIVKVDGKAVGKMKNIRIQENIRRGRVGGIGKLTPDELPAIEWNGTLNAGAYTVKFSESVIPKALVRKVNTVDEFVDTVLLQENGVQIDLMRKISSGPADPVTGIIPSELEIFASIKGCFATREGFDVQEGQISGRDVDFEYTTPILYPL
jgi:hypothetical protein